MKSFLGPRFMHAASALALAFIGSAAAGQPPTTGRAASIVVPDNCLPWLDRAEAEVPRVEDAKKKSVRIKEVAATRACILVFQGRVVEAWAIAERQQPEARQIVAFSIVCSLDQAGDSRAAEAGIARITDEAVADGAYSSLSFHAMRAGNDSAANLYASKIRGDFRRSMQFSEIASRQLLAGSRDAASKTAQSITDETYRKRFQLLMQADAIFKGGGDLAKAVADRGLSFDTFSPALVEVIDARSKAGDVATARQFADQIPSPLSRASALAHIGLARNAAGDRSGALAYYQLALRSVEKVDEKNIRESGLAPMHVSAIALAQREAGDDDAALKSVQRLKELMEELAAAVTGPILVEHGKIDEALNAKGNVQAFYLGPPPAVLALLKAHREPDILRWVTSLPDPSTRAALDCSIVRALLVDANPSLEQ
jgi:tetratricopeptide (TPR) repeat protein